MNPGQLYVSLRRRWLYNRCLRGSCRLIVLRYHSVGDPDQVAHYLDPGLSIPPERFRQQIRLLVKKFRIAQPDEIPALLSRPDHSRFCVVISFDDGYRDNYDVALPILVQEGATAAFYITTRPLTSGRGLWTSELWRLIARLPAGPLGLETDIPLSIPESPRARCRLSGDLTRWLARLPEPIRERQLNLLAERAGLQRGEGLGSSFLTPDHLRAMRKAGMTIGAHTRSHPHLDHVDPTCYSDELMGSRRDLEAILSEPVHHFAYPNPGAGGIVRAEVRRKAEESGFQTAMTSIAKPIGRNADQLRLPRLGVYAGRQERLLFSLLQSVG